MTQREPPNFGSYRPTEGADPNRVPPTDQSRDQHPHPHQAPRRPAPPPRSGARRGYPQPPAKPRPGLLRIVFWSLAGLAAFAVAAVVLFLAFAPTDFIKDQLIAQVKSKTGRDLVVAGPTSLTLFPSLSVSMVDVSLSPPPGMNATPTVRMQKLQVKVPLLPLIRRDLQIERLVLTKPVIDLRIDKSGRRSWDFASAGDPAWQSAPVRYAQAGTSRTDAPPALHGTMASALGPLENITLGDLRIIDGVVRYIDERASTSEELRELDLNLRGERLGDPLSATGNLTWRGERIDFTSNISTPKALLSDQLARVELSLMTRKQGGLGLEGTVIAGPQFKLDGKLAADTPSVRKVVSWIGVEPPDVQGLGQLRLTGQISATPESIGLRGATIKLDKATAAGDVTVSIGRARPDIRANLSIDVLDLNDYLPAMAASETGAATAAPALPSPGTGGGATSQVQSIEDLLKREGGATVPGRFSPKVKGYTKRKGWSDEPLDLTPLRGFDANANLTVGRLIYHDIKAGRSRLDLNLKDGVMQTLLREVELYQGSANGQLRLDARAAVPHVSANFALEGLAALAFLKDASDFDWIDGKARINFSVVGRGISEMAIVSSLNGKAAINFTDGAVVGYDVPKLVRGLQQGQFGSLERNPAERTDFSSLTSTYQIANGIATNKDLKLVSPLLRTTGEGTVDLAARQIDYLVRPRLEANLSGDNAGKGASALELPFKVKGPWQKPKITPVLDAVLQNPGAVVDTVKNLADKFKNKKGVSDALKGLLGNRQSEDGGAKPSTQELLKQLFR